jgi:hypothetical protein
LFTFPQALALGYNDHCCTADDKREWVDFVLAEDLTKLLTLANLWKVGRPGLLLLLTRHDIIS